MWVKTILLVAVVCLGQVVLAEDANVDAVLKTSHTVSEEALDEAAQEVSKPTETRATEPKAASLTAPVVAKSATVPESQIPVLRDEVTSKGTTSSPWMRMFGCAIFVLAIAGAIIWSVKRTSKARNVGGKAARIEVLHQHFLGPKKSVALIQVAGEAMLIGVTEHNINMLKSIALIDDELAGQPQDFHGFLEDDFAIEEATAPSRGRVV